MAKMTKTVASAPAPAEKQPSQLGEQAKARAVKAQGDVFKATGNKLPEGTKLPKQASDIVDVITKAGKAGITRAKLVEDLKGVLVTKQPESRILAYYQKDLQEAGLVTLTKAE